MGIELSDAGTPFIPAVPSKLSKQDPDLYQFLVSMKLAVEQMGQGAFTNTFLVATAMNLGTSGTFAISSGGSIVVTSGIVITVTS